MTKRLQKHAAAVEVTVTGIQMGAAYGQVPAVHFDADLQWPSTRLHLPAVFIQLGYCHWHVIAIRAQRHHMAGEVADHIATRNPRRHTQYLPFWGRCWNG